MNALPLTLLLLHPGRATDYAPASAVYCVMSGYRTSATFDGEGALVVRMPEAPLAGTEVEILVLLLQTRQGDEHPLHRLLSELRDRLFDPDGTARAQAAQASLRELRDEWD